MAVSALLGKSSEKNILTVPIEPASRNSEMTLIEVDPHFGLDRPLASAYKGTMLVK